MSQQSKALENGAAIGVNVRSRRPAREAADSVKRVISGATLVFVGTMVWQASNFVFNGVGAHVLGPARYGTLAASLALLSFVGPLLTATQAVTSRETTTLADRGELAKIRPMLRHYGLRVTGGGLILGAIVAGTSGWISSLFRLGSPWLVVIVGAVIPAYALGHVLAGVLQGAERFGRFALESLVEGSAKAGLRDPGHGAPVALGPFRHGSRRPELRRRRRDVPSNDTAAPGPQRALTGRCRYCRRRRHPGPRRPACLPSPVPAPVSPASHWPP